MSPAAIAGTRAGAVGTDWRRIMTEQPKPQPILIDDAPLNAREEALVAAMEKTIAEAKAKRDLTNTISRTMAAVMGARV